MSQCSKRLLLKWLNPLSPDQVKVYVGNPHTTFIVKNESLEKSTLLVHMVKEHDGESYIMSPMLSDFDADDFIAVSEYLDHYEYKPGLLDEGTDYARLEGIETDEERSRTIIQCGVLYGIGERLMLRGLSGLAIRKFKALMPYIPDDFLLIARLLYLSGRPADESLHVFIVDYVSENFYELWQAESDKFRLLLQEQKDLAKDVFARKGMGAKIEEPAKDAKEEGIKEESQDSLFV